MKLFKLSTIEIKSFVRKNENNKAPRMVMPNKICESAREYLNPRLRKEGFHRGAQTKKRPMTKIILLFFMTTRYWIYAEIRKILHVHELLRIDFVKLR